MSQWLLLTDTHSGKWVSDLDSLIIRLFLPFALHHRGVPRPQAGHRLSPPRRTGVRGRPCPHLQYLGRLELVDMRTGWKSVYPKDSYVGVSWLVVPFWEVLETSVEGVPSWTK